MISEFFKLSNWLLYPAIGFAVFFGLRAVYIFVDPKIHKRKTCKNWDWWIYQVLFNAVGAFIGWVALYYIWETSICKFEIKHFVALIIAFLGITGNLPFAVLVGKILGIPKSK